MEEQIDALCTPRAVWQAWERAHAQHNSEGIQEGQKGKAKFRYQILEVIPGQKFSILWKSFGTRLIFTHSVEPIPQGSRITYQVQIRGLFAWPLKRLIGEKIRQNIRHVLNAMAKELERLS